MRILFLTSRIDSPSFRFRVVQYLPYLKKSGWSFTIQEIPKSWFKRRLWLSGLGNFDVIFVQRKLLGAFELKQLKKKAKKLCYDFDDALMYKDSSEGAVISKRREKRFRLIMQTADMVIAGNNYLTDKAKEFSGNVTVIPTTINTEMYVPIEKESGKEVILGWMGTRSTLVYLNGLSDILEKVLSNFENIKLKVVCNNFSGFNISNAIVKKWDIHEEVSDLQGFDIGLMPLPDDAWTRGKCGFKLIQYMAVGIPVVCSPVGVNREIVTHGVNGFLAESSESWEKYLSLLVEDMDLCKQLGLAGREFVEKNYSLDYWGPYMNRLLKKLMELGK